ncbi:tetratricopeptide repeat protein [Kordiimonas gwangyangensis]|uniref:tetratricopeptide repeat protein n=1 Tax=Kordiimonas gwangyangensis TaxID=288022 RepID=UPI000375B2C3|nr:tetratricopeptide repeat protein [Kordiimonas gwangyangensis]
MQNDISGGLTGVWHFANIELNERTGAVTVDGVVADIDRAGFLILCTLAHQAGETVSKDTLLAAAWPGRIVSENTLAKAISRLRTLMGEERDLIKAVHGFGYRLQAEVSFTPLEDAAAEPTPGVPDYRKSLIGWQPFAAIIAAVLVAASLWQAQSASNRAAAAEADAEALASLVADDILSLANPYRTNRLELNDRTLVERTVKSIEDRFNHAPRAAAKLHNAVAHAYSGWGEYARAAEHLFQARDLYAGLGGDHLADVAEMELSLCQQLRLAGDVRAALDACKSATASAEAAGIATAPARVTYAKALFEDGQYARTTEILRPVTTADADENSVKTRADAHWFLALSERKLADFDAAQADFLDLLELQIKTHGDAHPLTAWAYSDYGDFLIDIGDFETGQKVLAKAQGIFNATLGPDHPESLSPGYSVALMHAWRHEWVQARDLLLPRLAGWRATIGSDHLWTLYTITELALAEAELDHRLAADQYLKEARKTGERLLYNRASKAVHFHLRWARVELALGNWDAAQAELDLAAPKLAATFADDHPWRGQAHCLLARVAAGKGDDGRGLREARQCLSVLLASLPEKHPAIIEARAIIAKFGTHLAQIPRTFRTVRDPKMGR